MPRKKKRAYKLFKTPTFDLELFILLAISAVLFFTVYIFKENYKLFIYPEAHMKQASPKKYVEQAKKNLAPNIAVPEVIEHGPRDKHQIALTFDADMTPAMVGLLQRGVVKSWINTDLINTLEKEHIPATFFFTGLWVKSYPKEAKDLANNPLFEIGNHSYSHPAFAKNCYMLPLLDNTGDFDEVAKAQEIISQTTGKLPKYFRFPGGCYEKIDLETIAKLGLKIVHWDVVSGDGFNQNVSLIVRNVESKIQNGSIVVFHLHGGPYAPRTNEALQKIIPDLRKQGYQFVTISQMLSGQ